MTAATLLKLALRITGFVTFCAIFFVFIPREWMDRLHQRAGMGTLPEGPVVEYLARTISALYTVLGGLSFLAASNLDRYATLIRYIAWCRIGYGALILAVDRHAGMPAAWTALEGPAILLPGIVILLLHIYHVRSRPTFQSP